MQSSGITPQCDFCGTNRYLISSAAKPRVLISYFFGEDTIPLGEMCARGFENLGFDVYRFHSQAIHPLEQYFFKRISKLLKGLGYKSADVSKNTRWGNHNYRQWALEQAATEFRPDIVLVIRGNLIEGDTLRRLKANHGTKKTIGWWVKDPRQNNEMLDDALSYDHYYSIHEEGFDPATGIKTLPALAPDTRIMDSINLSTPRTYKHEVVFVGGWSPKREEHVRALRGLPVELYGPGWLKKKRMFDRELRSMFAGKRIWGDALIDLYKTSKIVLNITNWPSQGKAGLNLRVVEVPATGAFLITDYPEESRKYVEPGKEVETYTTPEELRQKVEYYLANDEAREAIADAGFRRMRQHETITDRIKVILQDIGFDHQESVASWNLSIRK